MKSPLITMSALTGKPSQDDIYSYMKDLKDNGIDALLIYPRSGCEIEYLSEEWFSAIGHFISAAVKLDMDIWLYDDFNWPSGDCKGRVSAIPEFRLMSINVRGDGVGTISCKSRHNSGLFGEKFFPNLLSCDAVDLFISLTHDEYYKRFGTYFGTVIKGFFTDEPSIGYCITENSIPYYHGLKDDYRLKYGRDFDNDVQSGAAELYKNAMTLVSNKFKTAYLDKLAGWCKSRGILLTGHLMCDEYPHGAVCHAGNFLENLKSFSKPGIDDIFTNLSDKNEMLLYATAEYAGRENGGMAELFALGPSDISYAKRRATLFLCACHKIDTYFLAISHMDISGNMKVCDFFSDFDTLQPDFSGMRILAMDAKAAAEYAKKDFDPEVYIKYPTELIMENITKHNDYSALIEVMNELSYRGVQWKLTNGENDKPCIEIDIEGKLLYCGREASAEEIALSLDKKQITDKSGKCVKGIFLRKFNDGTFVAINLFAPEGSYLVCGKELYFSKHEVHINAKQSTEAIEEISCEFSVEQKNPSVTRLTYLNGAKTSKIVANEDATVRFAVRSDAELYLDGKRIAPLKPSEHFPRAARNYYGVSEAIFIGAGEHTVTSGNDYKYMPSVLVIGEYAMPDFSTPSILHIEKRTEKYRAGEQLFGFGEVCFRTKISAPSSAKGILLSGTELYTEVYVNGEKIGERICPPYSFYFKREYIGEITLEIVQKTSISPVFGNTKYWDENASDAQWRGTPSTSEPLVGFDKISFIL